MVLLFPINFKHVSILLAAISMIIMADKSKDKAMVFPNWICQGQERQRCERKVYFFSGLTKRRILMLWRIPALQSCNKGGKEE